MREIFSKVWDKIKNGIGFVSAIITVVLVFVGAKEYAFWLALATIVALLIVVLTIVVPIFRTKRAERRFRIKYYEKEKRVHSELHKYLHRLRNDTATINLEKTASKAELNKSCEILCAEICGIINDICKEVFSENEHFSVCVKTVKAKSISDTDYTNWKLETFWQKSYNISR